MSTYEIYGFTTTASDVVTLDVTDPTNPHVVVVDPSAGFGCVWTEPADPDDPTADLLRWVGTTRN